MNARTHQELAGFIWRICNLLRGTYKRNEYRKVILPLTVLRRFDSVMEDTKQAVRNAHETGVNLSEEVRHTLLLTTAQRGFYNVSPFDFTTLLNDPNNLAQNLQTYINNFSPNVRDIIDKFGFSEHIQRMSEKNLLYNVITEFSRVDLSPQTVDNTQMGYVFEELIQDRLRASQRGSRRALHASRGHSADGQPDPLVRSRPQQGRHDKDCLRSCVWHRGHAVRGRRVPQGTEQRHPANLVRPGLQRRNRGPSANQTS